MTIISAWAGIYGVFYDLYEGPILTLPCCKDIRMYYEKCLN